MAEAHAPGLPYTRVEEASFILPRNGAALNHAQVSHVPRHVDSYDVSEFAGRRLATTTAARSLGPRGGSCDALADLAAMQCPLRGKDLDAHHAEHDGILKALFGWAPRWGVRGGFA